MAPEIGNWNRQIPCLFLTKGVRPELTVRGVRTRVRFVIVRRIRRVQIRPRETSPLKVFAVY